MHDGNDIPMLCRNNAADSTKLDISKLMVINALDVDLTTHWIDMHNTDITACNTTISSTVYERLFGGGCCIGHPIKVVHVGSAGG